MYIDTNKTVVLIPAYEPNALLSTFVREIKSRTDFEIIVVDDGSSSESTSFFESIGNDATILRHETNQGKGAAIKTGLTYIEQHFSENTIIVTADADGQHKVDDMVSVCNAARTMRDTLVVGSRIFTNTTPLRSRFGNTITRYVFMAASGLKLHDTQTGLRAFRAAMIPLLLDIKGNRFEYEMNMLLDCSKHNVNIKEVPIEAVYIGDNSSSHFHTFRDSFIIYRDIAKFASFSLASFLVDFCVFSSMIELTGNLEASLSILISNVVARMISASFNYYVNMKYVFKSKESIAKTALGYSMLAISILVMDTMLLTLVVPHVIPNKLIGKVVVELIMFTLSWTAQRFFIFNSTQRRKPLRNE